MNKTIQLLTASLDSDPANWDIRLHIARLLLAENNPIDAAQLLQAYTPPPETEEQRLDFAEIIQTQNPTAALDILDLVISQNKAAAAAYLLKAHILLAQGKSDLAKKQYNVATVIDESLEDPEFEAKLNQFGQTTPIANTNQNLPETTPATQNPEPQPDEFIETDHDLDKVLADSAKLIDFSDIGGMEDLKERIRMSIIYPFKNKELFKKFKKRSGGGLLFYGPPGCGKTLISRATAGECGAHFINISAHDILSKWIGESEQRIHALFTEARRKAPTVIFIDEVDALGVKRSDAGHTASLVNTLLIEMDGSQSDNEDLLIIGATNTPWRVDSAFRRPGRFDHVLFVPPPDLKARAAILEILLTDIPSEKIDIKKIAKATEKYSGADLRSLIDQSTETVIQQIMRTGQETPLTNKHIQTTLKTTRPTTLEWIEQASNYASYANKSGLYDDLAQYIKSL